MGHLGLFRQGPGRRVPSRLQCASTLTKPQSRKSWFDILRLGLCLDVDPVPPNTSRTAGSQPSSLHALPRLQCAKYRVPCTYVRTTAASSSTYAHHAWLQPPGWQTGVMDSLRVRAERVPKSRTDGFAKWGHAAASPLCVRSLESTYLPVGRSTDISVRIGLQA